MDPSRALRVPPSGRRARIGRGGGGGWGERGVSEPIRVVVNGARGGVGPGGRGGVGTREGGAGVGVGIVPNFARGGVPLFPSARLASRYFEAAEIVELHHDGKVDAPSGTALATAEAMVRARGEGFAV